MGCDGVARSFERREEPEQSPFVEWLLKDGEWLDLEEIVGVGMPAHEEDGQGRVQAGQTPGELEAIELGHAHVGQDDIEVSVGQGFERLAAVGCEHDLMTGSLQPSPQRAEQQQLVVDDEHVHAHQYPRRAKTFHDRFHRAGVGMTALK